MGNQKKKDVLDPTKVPGFPTPKYELCDITKLVFDFVRNPRLSALYFVSEMVESLKIHGQKTPIMVSVQASGDYLPIRGNRRGKALLWLAEFEPEFYKVAFGGKITVQVYRGLSVEQEDALWVDHGESRSLSRYEQYLACRPFVIRGENRKKIGSRFGHGEGWAQLQSNIMSLPDCVTETWKAYTLNPKEGVKLPDKILGLLYTAWCQANKDEGHPSWTDAWNKALLGEIDTGPSVQTATAVKKMQEILKSREYQLLLGWMLKEIDAAELLDADDLIRKAVGELKEKAGIVSA